VFEFHRQLLADEVRTIAFRDAVRRMVRPDDVVLDIGTGTGLLAFFACEAGARRVYAVEQLHTADAAAMLARKFGYAGRLTVFHARSHEVELPEPATLLVSETLGSMGFDEGFLSTVADARRRLLSRDARIIPSHVELWAAPVEVPEFYAKYVDWWGGLPYGYDLAPLRVFASNTAYSTDGDMPLLAPIETAMRVTATEIAGTTASGHASFRTVRPGVIHGFAVGFRATLAPDVTVTNLWGSGTSSWERGVLPLETPIEAAGGVTIELAIETDNGRRWRWSGTIGGTAFDQNTVLSRPPCMLEKQRL
jgi:protein arginine N-methyltransferase 1